MTLRFDPGLGIICTPDDMPVAFMDRSAHERDPSLGHAMAAAIEMREALEAIMAPCGYGVLSVGPTAPGWHSIRTPTPEVMDKVRLALEKARS